MAKATRISDEMHVALAGLRQALRMASRMDDLGQIRKLLTEADEQAELLMKGLTAIRDHVGKI